MTFTFECPQCGNLCAFDEKHVGRRARCLHCHERFTIPAPGTKAKAVPRIPERPLGGFFHEALLRTPRAVFRTASATGTVFLTALVVFRFFLSHVNYSLELPGFTLYFPLGLLAVVITCGLQAWYYMEIIGATYLECDILTESDLGSGFEFAWAIIKSAYLFICAFLTAILPLTILACLLREVGVWQPWVLYPLPWLGVLFLPTTMLIISTGQEFYQVFRPDNLVLPLIKAPLPYLTVVILTLGAGVLELATMNFGGLLEAPIRTQCLHLLGNLAAMYLGVTAMRAIGLFGRHYECRLPWLK